MPKSTIAVCSAMFIAPFLLLAAVYEMLPSELPVMRMTVAGGLTLFRSVVRDRVQGRLRGARTSTHGGSLGTARRWAAAGTVASVVGGMAPAFFRSRNARVAWRDLRLSMRDPIELTTLLALYVAVVVRSFFIAHRS